jgi:hypothetical protein
VNLALGAAGAVAAGVLGAVGWFQLTKATGFEFGFIAWAIGGLVGWGARLFVPQGSFALAGVAALSACLSIMGGQALVTRHFTQIQINRQISVGYNKAVSYAKTAVELAEPQALREHLARHSFKLRSAALPTDPKAGTLPYRQLAEMESLFMGVIKTDGKRATFTDLIQSADPGSITDADLAEFREKEVPELRDLIAGKPSKAEYESTMQQLVKARVSLNDLILESVGMYTMLWLFLGIGTAWKLANNSTDAVSD